MNFFDDFLNFYSQFANNLLVLRQLFRSSKGVVFMWFFFVFIGLFYCIAKFIEKRYKILEDYGTETHIPGTSAVIVAPAPVSRPPEVKSPLLAQFIEFYQQFLYEYLPYLAMAVLNVIIVRSWAFNLVNLFLVLVPMWLFNILKLVPPRFMCLSVLARFMWMGWMIGFFINIWTVSSY